MRNPAQVDSVEMGSCEMTATEVAALLDLKPHPEGGYYAETFRDSSVSLTTAQLPPQCMHMLTPAHFSSVSFDPIALSSDGGVLSISFQKDKHKVQ